jgi:hypothetical protein
MDLSSDWLMSGAAIGSDRHARPFQGDRGAFVNMTWGSDICLAPSEPE